MESLCVKHIIVSVYMVRVYMSSMFYVLSCGTKLVLMQRLNENDGDVFALSNTRAWKEGLKRSLIINLRYYSTPYLICQQENIILHKTCGYKVYRRRILY